MQHSEYYQHLRALSPKGAGVLAAKLFHGTEWYTEGVLGLSSKSALKSKVATQVIPTDNSEKAQTIESLKKFANEKLEQTPGGKIAIPGGEVAVKEGASLGRKITIQSSQELLDWTSEVVEVVFFGESSKLGGTNQDEDMRASELLDKMIFAMKISPEKVVKIFHQTKLPESGTEFDQLMISLLKSKPKFLISLGAVATNTLLGRKEKLTKVHGQFFPIKIHSEADQHEVKLMPLFHPDFLLINPNMKRAAWTDLQKIMSSL